MPGTRSPAQRNAILRCAGDVLEEAIAFLQGLIRIPTVNPPGEEYPECAHYIGERLQALGYDVEYIELSPAEVAELAPYGSGLPRVNVLGRLPGSLPAPVMHFNGHMDVVPAGSGWSCDPFGGVISSGRIYGRGVSDMKGGIAAQVYAIEAIRRAGVELQGTIEQSGVVDEESTGNRNAGMGLLVERGYIAALFDGTLQFYTRSAYRLDGIDLCCNAALHVGYSAPVDAPAADDTAEGITGPARASRYDVHVPVEVHHRCRQGTWQSPEDVDARQTTAIGSELCHFRGG